MDYQQIITLEPGKRGLRTIVYGVLEYLAFGLGLALRDTVNPDRRGPPFRRVPIGNEAMYSNAILSS